MNTTQTEQQIITEANNVPKLKDLLSQKAALELQISEVRKTELGEAIALVKGIIDEYGLTSEDVFQFSKPKSKGGTSSSGTKVAPKYRDPSTGAVWTGRGKAPKWIEGKERSDFLIDQPVA